MHCRCLGWLSLLSMMTACTGAPMLKYEGKAPAQTLSLLDAPAVEDGRARFRQIFCGLAVQSTDRRGRSCEELLHRLVDERKAMEPKPLPAHDPRFELIFVPGILSGCTRHVGVPFETAIPRLRALGYSAQKLSVGGRSSSAANAADIAAALAQRKGARDLVLVGYSKGAVDILEFLVAYPEQAARVRAVVSVAGAVNGSPLADRLADFYDGWLKDVGASQCPPGDGGALDSLRYSTRLNWLARHRLPQHVRYYSLAAFTRTDAVSAPLRPFAAALAEIDPRNDGLLLFYDQVIPGAALLGYANADHWAVAIPIEEKHPWLATLVTGHNYYPRDALIEALVLYVVEDLAVEKTTR